MVYLLAVNCSVTLPAAPLIASPLNVASPFALVTAVPLLSVADPLVTDTETVMPDLETALPNASLSWTAGCGESAAPFVALEGGAIVKVSAAPVPASAVALNVTGLPARPLAVAVMA